MKRSTFADDLRTFREHANALRKGGAVRVYARKGAMELVAEYETEAPKSAQSAIGFAVPMGDEE